jgi:hypothetical protein
MQFLDYAVFYLLQVSVYYSNHKIHILQLILDSVWAGHGRPGPLYRFRRPMLERGQCGGFQPPAASRCFP